MDLRVPEARVVVEGDLAVEREHLVVGRPHQRVDLDQRRLLADEDLPERGDDLRCRLAHHLGDRSGIGDLARLVDVDAGDRVDGDPGQRVGPFDRELLDLHAALGRAHREVGPVRPVEQEGEVVLLTDVRGLGDQHGVDREPLDVHPEDVAGAGLRVVGGGAELHATRLAAAARLHLRLDHHRTAAKGLRSRPGLLGRRHHYLLGDGYAVPAEQLFRLPLEQVHASLLQGHESASTRYPSGHGVRGPGYRPNATATGLAPVTTFARTAPERRSTSVTLPEYVSSVRARWPVGVRAIAVA